MKDGGTVTYTQDGNIHVNESKVEEKEAHNNPYDQIIVPKGRFGRLILADGSELYINSGTKVVYPKRFEKNRREIFVDGEIYIDVKRDEKAPFIVKTAKFDVEVLGTAFDVKAYSEENNCGEIVLLRGLVNVKSTSGSEAMLTPDNKAVVPSQGTIRTMAVDAADYILWTKGILPLNNGTVGDIIDDLGVGGRFPLPVGICEQHAVSLISGLAKNNLHPIFLVMANFLQRSYDQLNQDLALNDLKATIVLFNARINGGDATHVGMFDIAMLSNIPNLTLLAPTNVKEYLEMLEFSFNFNHPVIIRAPIEVNLEETNYSFNQDNYLKYQINHQGSEVALIALGYANETNIPEKKRKPLSEILF